MNRPAAHGWVVLALLAVLVAGCGVDSEDAPRPIQDSTQEPDTTPSVDTRPAPTPNVTTSSPTTTASPQTTSRRVP